MGLALRYTTIQNWSDSNLGHQAGQSSKMPQLRWIDGNLGAKTAMKYPSAYLDGGRSAWDHVVCAFTNAGQHQDTGAKMILIPLTLARLSYLNPSRRVAEG